MVVTAKVFRPYGPHYAQRVLQTLHSRFGVQVVEVGEVSSTAEQELDHPPMAVISTSTRTLSNSASSSLSLSVPPEGRRPWIQPR